MSFGSWVWSWVKRVRGVSNYIVGLCESVAMLMGRLWGGDKGCEGIGSGRVGRVSMAQAPPRFPLSACAWMGFHKIVFKSLEVTRSHWKSLEVTGTIEMDDIGTNT